MTYQVIKINGEKEEFSEQKIRRSATRVGVPKEMQDQMIDHIRSKLYDNIPTTEIFKHIKEFLRHENQPGLTAKYNLKQGIMQLGPSGYPFEKYLSTLLEKYNFKTSINLVLDGKCVTHEVDVKAINDDITYLIEAKFHNKQSLRTDIKVVLYIKARYDDLAANWHDSSPVKPWIITNSRFTTDAIKYGKCAGIKLTSWDYPDRDSLREMVDKTQLHPVTVIDSISRDQKRDLLEAGVVSCQDLLAEEKIVKNILNEKQYKEVLNEAKQICQLK